MGKTHQQGIHDIVYLDNKVAELEAERDQLRARVAELESALREMQRNGQKQGWNDHYASSMGKVSDVLNRTPAQSLAEIKAQALEKAASDYYVQGRKTYAANIVGEWLLLEAKRLRTNND